MNFNNYKAEIKKLLIYKASNNKDREAGIRITEFAPDIFVKDDMTRAFATWLNTTGWVDNAKMEGKNYVRCIVSKTIL